MKCASCGKAIDAPSAEDVAPQRGPWYCLECAEGYDTMGHLIVLALLEGKEDARTCSAMVSAMKKAQQRGQACPGYVALLELAKHG